MLRKTEHLRKIVGCFWLFSGVNVIVVCFCVCVSGKVAQVLKNACFSQFFGAFVGWIILLYLGFEGVGVFVFLVSVFLCLGFFVALFLFCCWIVFGVVLVLFLYCFF